MSEGDARESRGGMCAGQGAGVPRGGSGGERSQGGGRGAERRQVCPEEAGVSTCSLTGLLSSTLMRCSSQLGADSRVAPSGSLG